MRLLKFHDTEPDRHGRRSFVLFWAGEDRADVTAPGGRTGRLRGQEFHADPSQYEPFTLLVVQAGETEAQAAKRMLGIP